MNLTSTEKYALAVLETQGRLSSLQKREQRFCLAASCVWDLIQAGVVAADEKGRLRVSAPLPETLSYCAPVYELLAEKPRKPTRVVRYYIDTLTSKRIKPLVKSITDDLIDKSILVIEQQSGSQNVKVCHVDPSVIEEDIAAVKHMDAAAAQNPVMLAVLLLESGAAKKLLSKKELSSLKKTVRQTGSGFLSFVRCVKREILASEIVIIVGIVAAASSQLL